MIFFWGSKGLWGGRRGSVALFFREKQEEISLMNKIAGVVGRRQQKTK